MSLPPSLPPDPSEAQRRAQQDPLLASVVRAVDNTRYADCPDAEWLALYADQELGSGELAMVAPHLKGCDRCQAIVEAYARASAEPAGATSGGLAAWLAGWRWLVPVTATAAVVTVAVWIYRPAATPDQLVVREEAAAPAATAAQPAPSNSASTPDTSAQRTPQTGAPESRRDAPPRLSRDRFAGGTPPAGARADAELQEAVTLADARERTATAAPPASAALEARQEAAAPPAPASPAVAPQTPVAGRAAQDAAAKPADTARAKAAAAPAEGAGANTAGSLTVRQGLTGGVAVTGRVIYRAREALPAGAIVEVRLLDVSRMDVAAALLGRAEVVTRGEQVPVSFTVPYDPAAIDPRGRYTVQATITVAGRVAYRTTTAHPVLTGGAPADAVEVVVEPMR